jgi:tyrosine-protein kinase Etk/Wzc
MSIDATKIGSIEKSAVATAIAGGGDDNEMDLRQIFDLLWAGRVTVAIVTAVVFALFALYCIKVAPTYRADGLVQIEQSSGKSDALSQMSEISSLVLGSPVETQAEIQVLGSRMLLESVVNKLNLEIRAQPYYFPLFGGAIFRLNHAASKPLAVPGLLRAYAWGGEKIDLETLEVPDEYLGKVFKLKRTSNGYSIDFPDGKTLEGTVGELAKADTAHGVVSVYVRDLQAEVGTKFRIVRYSKEDILKQLSDSLKVAEQGKQSGVIGISFEGDSPDLVSNVINDLEDSYLRQNVERRSANAQQSLEFLEKQLPERKDQVDQAQLKLNAYQLQHGSVDVSRETELVLGQTVDLESERLKLQEQREEMKQRFTEQHPAVKALDEQIQSLESARGKVKDQVAKLPTTQQEIFSLMRDLDVSNELYAQMLNSIQELQVAKAGTVGNVRIVDRALKPLRPVKPKVAILLPVSIFIGLILGVAAVAAQRATIRGVDDPAEVESRLGLTTYAMIPFSNQQKQLNRTFGKGESNKHINILAAQVKDDPAIESLRSLRTSLHFALLEAANNVIMFTGPSPGLGKSFISVNLAALLALSGKKVVAVDADLRRGHLHRYIGESASPGISEYVAGDAHFDSLVHPTNIPGFDLVFRGTIPPNPSELLLHGRFSELVRILSEKYDYVILDTPPILAVTDAAIVGRLVGCTLLVLKSTEHSIREIDEAHRRLLTAGIDVKGVLFNQVGKRAGSYGYGNYGYSYYRYNPDT